MSGNAGGVRGWKNLRQSRFSQFVQLFLLLFHVVFLLFVTMTSSVFPKQYQSITRNRQVNEYEEGEEGDARQEDAAPTAEIVAVAVIVVLGTAGGG